MAARSQTTEAHAEELISLLRRQVSIYTRLEQLSGRQRGLIAAEDQQQLLTLLAERQKLVDELSALNQGLIPLQKYWRANRESVAPSLRTEADQLVVRAGEILQRILGADEQDARILSARKAQTAKQVTVLAQGRQAFEAYGGGVRQHERQLVRTDESA
jgi:hypothetical protein